MKQKERQQVEWMQSQCTSIEDLIRLGRYTEAISRAAGIRGTCRHMLQAGAHMRATIRRRNDALRDAG